MSSPEKRTGGGDAPVRPRAAAPDRRPYINGVGAFLPNAPVDKDGIEPILGSLVLGG